MKFLKKLFNRLVKFPTLSALPVHLSALMLTVDLRLARSFDRDLPHPLDRDLVLNVVLVAELLLLAVRLAALLAEFLLRSIATTMGHVRDLVAVSRRLVAHAGGCLVRTGGTAALRAWTPCQTATSENDMRFPKGRAPSNFIYAALSAQTSRA